MTSSKFGALRQALGRETDIAGLVAFRIALGALVTVSATRFLAYRWVDDFFVKPTFFFTYWGFSWVKPLPAPWMHVVFAAVAVLGACFAAGLAYRLSAALLFVLFAYIQLADVTNWLNHYYLVALLLLLATLMPIGRAWSVDAWRRPARALGTFPAWCTYLLRFQIGAVYFHAGLAKLTSDWLVHAQPLNIWLSARSDMPVIGALFDERWAAYAFSWGGFLFDTTIALFLLWRRTRLLAFAVVVVFHLMTWMLFPIGMFPFIMIASALVFFSPSWPRRLLRRAPVASATSETDKSSTLHPAWLALAAVYCAMQALMPLRHRLYGGNVLWHEQGMRFAWKVMVREKNGSITYAVEAPSAGRTWYVSPRKYLTEHQERELSGQPDLVLQLAHHIADEFKKRGFSDVRVHADALVSLNGRRAARMIDASADLAQIHDGLGKATWILPEPPGPPIHLRSSWNKARASADE